MNFRKLQLQSDALVAKRKAELFNELKDLRSNACTLILFESDLTLAHGNGTHYIIIYTNMKI